MVSSRPAEVVAMYEERDPTDLGLSPAPAEPPSSPGPVAHICNNGWLGENERGDVIPCLICRPHLKRGNRR